MEHAVNSRIKQLRIALSLSQVEFAKQCHLSPSIISKIESGEREASFKLTDVICTTFGVDESWLVQGLGEMSFTKKRRDEVDPWKEEAYRALKDEVNFYRQLLMQVTGGKAASFLQALNGTGLSKKRSLRAAA